MKKVNGVLALAAVFGLFGLAGPASAATSITATVGPVLVPGVPVSACIASSSPPVNECVSTPPAQTVTLGVTVTLNTVSALIGLPTITPVACPAGTSGVALKVNAGSDSVTVSGSVTVTVNGAPTTIALDPTVAVAGKTVTLYACAGVS